MQLNRTKTALPKNTIFFLSPAVCCLLNTKLVLNRHCICVRKGKSKDLSKTFLKPFPKLNLRLSLAVEELVSVKFYNEIFNYF